MGATGVSFPEIASLWAMGVGICCHLCEVMTFNRDRPVVLSLACSISARNNEREQEYVFCQFPT